MDISPREFQILLQAMQSYIAQSAELHKKLREYVDSLGKPVDSKGDTGHCGKCTPQKPLESP